MLKLEELLPLDKLESVAARSSEYQVAQPFPHVVLDNFLDEMTVQRLIDDFPKPTDGKWLIYKAKTEFDKLQSNSELSIPVSIRSMIYALNSSSFVRFLETLTGIGGLIPDPHLYGGGLHQTLPGGKLKMHIDYNYHERWKLDRRLNLILYLNEGWKEEWGGALELWDAKMTTCIKKIYPISNRVVVFSTSEISWHGHPDSLQCPPDRTRKSIALYYYTNGRPEAEKGQTHNTLFRERPGEAFGRTLKDLARDFVPPILVKSMRSITGARK